MGALGLHIALSDAQLERLDSILDDDDRVEYIVEDIESAWDDEFFLETDKAWDAIHRSVAGQQPNTELLDPQAGSPPLNLIIIGGLSILDDESIGTLHLIEPFQVKDLATALETLDGVWFADRYRKHCKGAWPEYGEEDMEYCRHYFLKLKEFFVRVVPTGRAVLFSVL